MSGTLHLITEVEGDGEIVKALLGKRFPQVKVRVLKPSGKANISRLSDQLKRLLKTALLDAGREDCIAILHDADLHAQPDRTVYDKIAQICKQLAYKKIKLVVAKDELEAWLLADSGLCALVGSKSCQPR